jgi:hypothetical protein
MAQNWLIQFQDEPKEAHPSPLAHDGIHFAEQAAVASQQLPLLLRAQAHIHLRGSKAPQCFLAPSTSINNPFLSFGSHFSNWMYCPQEKVTQQHMWSSQYGLKIQRKGGKTPHSMRSRSQDK